MEWKFLIDPFLVIAKESRKRAIEISKYTYGALKERELDAFFGPLYLLFKPLHEALMLEETEWTAQKGVQKGSTLSLDNLLKDLVVKANLWRLQVGVVYAPGCPEYVTIFPNGISALTEGKKDDRITALSACGQALANFAALAAVKAQVDATFTQINNARTGQAGKISDTKEESDDVTVALEAAMIGLYSLLGSCIAHFAATPLEIKPIFHIQLIRDLEQTIFVDSVAKNQTDFVFKRTLEAGKRLKITVTTDKTLRFALTDEKNDTIGTKFVEVAGLEDETFDASQLKVSDKAAFFKVYNPDGDVDGHFKVEILPE